MSLRIRHQPATIWYISLDRNGFLSKLQYLNVLSTADVAALMAKLMSLLPYSKNCAIFFLVLYCEEYQGRLYY